MSNATHGEAHASGSERSHSHGRTDLDWKGKPSSVAGKQGTGKQGTGKQGTGKRTRKRFRQPDRNLIPAWGKRFEAGSPHVLGAVVVPEGINFAVQSRHAQEVFLLLFDEPGGGSSDIIPMPGRTGFIRHVMVYGLKAGQLYAFRARGEFNPALGLRFNENKLLADPYARAFAGKFRNHDNLILSYDANSEEKDISQDSRDDMTCVPKCIAHAREFDWEGDHPPGIPMSELILYEVHVKGFTAHPSSGVGHPGTYLGFAEKIPYLQRLGVNAVELLPVHEKYTEDHLAAKGLSNYWGYNTVGFFAPESSYGTGAYPGCEVEEFKTLVKELHKAGIEAILDVVYNHTAEGNELGPTLHFRGLDNPEYYALKAESRMPKRYYHNFSGTGNTLDFGNPAVVRLAMDSLRYWVQEMHVDGFRFDLAPCLGRQEGSGFDPRAPFFQAVQQDPVLSRVKMIAEPWDLGTFEVGNFPVNWSEWNSKFRDNVRRFVKGDACQLNELGARLTGSGDLFGFGGRSADASINFVTCHDGFTLSDLVSYNEKHNEANLEDNRDGYNDNLSWNCGVEGKTEDEIVLALRRRQARNFFCLLLFAQGTPMLNAGDEVLRSQDGNNNAYCQDTPLGWMDWGLVEKNADTLAFVRKAIALRKHMPLLMGNRFLIGRDGDGNEVPDITWFGPDGGDVEWDNPEARQLAFQLDGFDDVAEGDGPPRREANRYFFILNAGDGEWDFPLPELQAGMAWHRVLDTSLEAEQDFLESGREKPLAKPEVYRARARSVVILLNRKARG